MLNEIVLIDDSLATNTLNKRLIENLGMADKISVFQNGRDGLDYLLSLEVNKIDFPRLILLDIDMPVMDGFQFLNEVSDKLSKIYDASEIVMLTTSFSPKDELKLKMYEKVKCIIHKPLEMDRLLEIIKFIQTKP